MDSLSKGDVDGGEMRDQTSIELRGEGGRETGSKAFTAPKLDRLRLTANDHYQYKSGGNGRRENMSINNMW